MRMRYLAMMLVCAICAAALTGCGGQPSSSSAEPTRDSSTVSSQGEEEASYESPSEESSEAYQASGYIAVSSEELQAFFREVEDLTRRGDLKLLDYLYDEEGDDLSEAVKLIFSDDTARELWCAAYAPTTWHTQDVQKVEFRTDSGVDDAFVDVGIKSPRWMHVKEIHLMRTNCAPLGNDPATLKSYFNEYADDIPYSYITSLRVYMVDNKLKMAADEIFSYIIDPEVYSLQKNPLQPFEDLVDVYEYTAELPELTEKQQRMTQYYEYVRDHKYREAYELASIKEYEMFFKFANNAEEGFARYDAMSDEDKAKVQAELDAMPPSEFYSYSLIGARGKLNLCGILISYKLEYGKGYEVFGEGLPVYEKHVTYCYDTTHISHENFMGFSSILRQFDKIGDPS